MKPTSQSPDFNIEIPEAIKQVYQQLDKKKSILNKNVILLDVRTVEEYPEGHLPCSINIDHESVLKNIKKMVGEFQGSTIYVICHSGSRSDLVVQSLRQKGIKAYNMIGGAARWSQLRHPLVKSITYNRGRGSSRP